MSEMILEASRHHADVIVFPELAVTGALDSDIVRFDQPLLAKVLDKLRATAKQNDITVVFGMPFLEKGRRFNSAFVLGPDGKLHTRYDQIVTDRTNLFAASTNAKSMWFKVKGVPAIVTVGSDARWNEIGELAAVRGAQLLFNLSYDQNVSELATLQRRQFCVQLASFGTFNATVNAADPRSLTQPSALANGDSAIWEDFDGHKKKPSLPVEVFSQYSASMVVSAGHNEKIIYAQRHIPKRNVHFQRLLARRYPHLDPWYYLGAQIISGEP